MSTAKILLDKWMKARSLASLKDASRELGKSSTALTNWRTGYAKPDDASIALMCEQCGEDGALWVAKLHAEFEADPRMKRVWLRLTQVAAAITLTVGLLTPTSTVHAQGQVFAQSVHSVYYVKL
jgi:hypothetical protein